MNDCVVCMINPGNFAPPQAHQLLTIREQGVLWLLAEGDNTALISVRLGISESTVRAHVEHMLDKLGANTPAELVALGFHLGYLD